MTARRTCQACALRRPDTKFTSARGTVCTDCQKRRRRQRARFRHVKKTYDLDAADYTRLQLEQMDRCAGCDGTRDYELSVDHDHALVESHGMRGSVRGLLCRRCNKILRDVRDDPQVLRQLADYLDDPPARKVLG
jgi:hypothetical protein